MTTSYLLTLSTVYRRAGSSRALTAELAASSLAHIASSLSHRGMEMPAAAAIDTK
jgi:hypothetical protein